MEESEKRRERLKAMRMEANHGGNDSILESSGMVSHGLSNPLIEVETESPANYASSRFGYYTDPMAAFSSNKKSSQVSHQVPQQYYNTPPRPRHPDMSHSPSYQDQSINSPGRRIFQAPGAYYNYGPVGSPSSSPSGRNPQSTWGAPIGDFNYSISSNLPRGSNFTSPGFGQGGTPNFSYGRGRGQRYNSSPLYGSGRGASPYPDSGRSRGRSSGYKSFSPGSGQRGRRGASSHGPVSAELRPDMYYNHEMVEDPWKELSPVIWKGQNVNPNSETSSLPKSISIKKPRVSLEVSNKSTSEPSLAEYLAASFSEAANNEAGDD
ncbi:protein SICKLE-like [Olea europaea var. sylvestris]|uniref:protein SICKLE-like n=1 Tax=Olea europaea var. sylvestris TaxID=158386 RepID=UPI000C1D27DD|nr:protein SICKLE-like [Olea europaea var. sylvestris]XP_022896886.1 protein SICKLE-like [Olea europaea var. sylvestris]